MELLERQAQLAELTQLLREAGANAGKMAIVSGEAGAGKSALVEEIARQASRQARIFWGHCDALQTSRVLGPVHEIAAGISLPRDTPGGLGDARAQLFFQLFAQFSPPHTLSLVILEDLHWADDATLDFLRFIGRRIQRTRCLLIATYRDDELAPIHPLRGVLGELTGQHTVRIGVPALSPAAVEQLVAGTSLDSSNIFEITAGNPFFVRELLSAPVDTVPQTVRDAILARLQQCSAAAREVAELVSLMPGGTMPWLIEALLGDAGAAADEAIMRGLLQHKGEALAFRHELGRISVESTMPRARFKDLHQSILRTLIDHDADLSLLVHHAVHAQDVKALLRYAPRAAEQAALAGAHREAAAHLATTLRFSEQMSAQGRAQLLEAHATECDVTNQVSTALGSANEALALWRELGNPEAQARVLLLTARQYWKLGQNTSADRLVGEAITLLEGLPPARGLAMAYSARAQLAMTSDHVDEAIAFGYRALELATQFQDNSVRAHALNNVGTALLESGDLAGLAQLEESLAVARAHNLQDHAGRAYANLVSTSVRQHLPDVVSRYLAEGIEYCEVHDVQDSLIYVLVSGAHAELNSGHWENAARTCTELIERQSLSIAQRVPALVVLARVRSRRGDPGVDHLLDEALRLALPTGELQRIGPVAAARAELAWYRGELTRAAEEAAIGLKAALSSRDPWIPGELVYWTHRANQPVYGFKDIAEPYALMIKGDWEGATRAWQQRVAPYERALALADGPEGALIESLSILERLGAGPLAAIVRQRLRERGVREIPRGPRASTRENPAGLTSRQVQVLRLLGQGYTTGELARRLHISAKTIDHHVSAILLKLDVHSRRDAVAAAFGLGVLKPTKKHDH